MTPLSDCLLSGSLSLLLTVLLQYESRMFAARRAQRMLQSIADGLDDTVRDLERQHGPGSNFKATMETKGTSGLLRWAGQQIVLDESKELRLIHRLILWRRRHEQREALHADAEKILQDAAKPQ